MAQETAYKVGEGTEVLTIIFSEEAACDFLSNVGFSTCPKESGGLGMTGEIAVSVMGTSVAFD
jgi:hypothetical protein